MTLQDLKIGDKFRYVKYTKYFYQVTRINANSINCLIKNGIENKSAIFIKTNEKIYLIHPKQFDEMGLDFL